MDANVTFTFKCAFKLHYLSDNMKQLIYYKIFMTTCAFVLSFDLGHLDISKILNVKSTSFNMLYGNNSSFTLLVIRK